MINEDNQDENMFVKKNAELGLLASVTCDSCKTRRGSHLAVNKLVIILYLGCLFVYLSICLFVCLCIYVFVYFRIFHVTGETRADSHLAVTSLNTRQELLGRTGVIGFKTGRHLCIFCVIVYLCVCVFV